MQARRRRPSRRSVVLAALGCAAAGPLASCSSGVDGARLSEGDLPTRFMPAPTRWRMALASSGPPVGLVVALHGFGASADMAFDLGLPAGIEATRQALVSVDGGNGYWHRRADGTDSGAMVRDELIPFALERAGLPARSPVTLLGWSMGGFGALLIAGDLGAKRVRSVVAVSAALWLQAGQTPAVAFDGRADFDEHTIFQRTRRLDGIRLRIDCGTDDPFVAANRNLAQRLPRAERHFTEGGHDAAYWSGRAADQLRWVAAS